MVTLSSVAGLLRAKAASGVMQYDKSVRTLNLLQTSRSMPKFRDASCLVAMQECLHRVDISQQDLKDLNIIHISGTKGKGSTSAFVESILRHHGYKTGFFSSPHLIEVRERIRINGQPISKKQFSEYFEDIYTKLTNTIEGSSFEYPSYFYFLTAMAFHVFKQQRVDVAVMEVGIGGTFDCTNVVQNPSICGVTSLGYDHVEILGETIESIAWHKAGIFKHGVRAYTVPQQYTALQVMAQTAHDIGINLEVCPDFNSYKVPSGKKIKLGLSGDHQKINASLALQLAEAWMGKRKLQDEEHEYCQYRSEVDAFPSPAMPFPLTETHLKALENCQWKGRAEVMKFNNLTFYMDGAHTVNSMKCCAKWFRDAADEEERSLGKQCLRILVFNITGKRDAAVMFEELQECLISYAVFTPNIATFVSGSADQTNLKSTLESQLLCTVRNHEEWTRIQTLKHKQLLNGTTRYSPPLTKAPIFATIADAVSWLSEDRDEKLFMTSSKLASSENRDVPLLNDVDHIQVLVTGSVHLVGGFLRILDATEIK